MRWTAAFAFALTVSIPVIAEAQVTAKDRAAMHCGSISEPDQFFKCVAEWTPVYERNPDYDKSSAEHRSDLTTPLRVKNWSGGAYSDGGNFAYCAFSAAYRGDEALMFMIAVDGHWAMAYANSALKLAPGTPVNVSASVDGGDLIPIKGIAATDQLVRFDFGTAAGLDQFRRAARLRLYVSGATSIAFDLTDFSAMSDELQRCYSKRGQLPSPRSASTMQAAESESPIPTKAVARTPSDTAATLKLEATKLVSNLLSSIGDTGFRLMSDDELPAAMRGYQVVWTDADGIGFFDIRQGSKQLARLEQLSAAVIATAAAECKNNFGSQSLGAPRADSRQLKVTCVKDDGSGPTTEYTLIQREGNVFWIFGYYGVSGGEVVQGPEHKLRDAFLAKYSQN